MMNFIPARWRKPLYRTLAGRTALAAAYIGVLATLAFKRADVWPFLAMFAITGFGVLLGLSNYGSGEPADDIADSGHTTRSRVSW